MAELTSETTFTVIAAAEAFEETADLYLFPENDGALAVRELRYPGDVLPPLFYESNPDRWENFDSVPMTNRPQVKAELTIASAQIVQWKGYLPGPLGQGGLAGLGQPVPDDRLHAAAPVRVFRLPAR